MSFPFGKVTFLVFFLVEGSPSGLFFADFPDPQG